MSLFGNVAGSRPCSEGFSPSSLAILPIQRPTFLNSISIWNQMPLQISIYFLFYFIILFTIKNEGFHLA